MPICSKCSKECSKDDFSRSQKKKKAVIRKCKGCVDQQESGPSDNILITKSMVNMFQSHFDHFSDLGFDYDIKDDQIIPQKEFMDMMYFTMMNYQEKIDNHEYSPEQIALERFAHNCGY